MRLRTGSGVPVGRARVRSGRAPVAVQAATPMTRTALALLLGAATFLFISSSDAEPASRDL